MSSPVYQAPVVKASRCGNERQEWSDRRKAGRKGSGKKMGSGEAGKKKRLRRKSPGFEPTSRSVSWLCFNYASKLGSPS